MGGRNRSHPVGGGEKNTRGNGRGNVFLEFNYKRVERSFASSNAMNRISHGAVTSPQRCIAVSQEQSGSSRGRLIEDAIRKKQNPPGCTAGGSVK
jgi:hypothetical protein